MNNKFENNFKYQYNIFKKTTWKWYIIIVLSSDESYTSNALHKTYARKNQMFGTIVSIMKYCTLLIQSRYVATFTLIE